MRAAFLKSGLAVVLLGVGSFILPPPAPSDTGESKRLEVVQNEPKAKEPQPQPPSPKVTLPATLSTPQGRLARLVIAYDGDDLQWTAPAALDVFREYAPDSQAVVLRIIGYDAGNYDVVAVTCKGGKLSPFARCVVTVGTPVPPVPPVPPGPTPPGPTPPGPAPIPADGLRVLILWDKAQEEKLSPGQFNVMYSQPMRDYLNQKCVIGPDGKTKEWRIWPADTPPEVAPKLWGDALKRGQKSLPWIIVSNGKAGYEGPLPSSPADAQKLIDQYAGK